SQPQHHPHSTLLPYPTLFRSEPAASSQPAVANPLTGEAIPLENVNDPTFAAGILGQGYAVIPSEGKVYAPFDGSVETLMDTHHADRKSTRLNSSHDSSSYAVF